MIKHSKSASRIIMQSSFLISCKQVIFIPQNAIVYTFKNPEPFFCVSRGAIMSSLPEATRSLMQVFNGKLQDFTNEIDTVHMVWLEEIQQEAYRMFSRWERPLMWGGVCYTLYTFVFRTHLFCHLWLMWDSLLPARSLDMWIKKMFCCTVISALSQSSCRRLRHRKRQTAGNECRWISMSLAAKDGEGFDHAGFPMS